MTAWCGVQFELLLCVEDDQDPAINVAYDSVVWCVVVDVQFELLLCVEDDQDPAINVVQRLQQRYPAVSCRLYVGGKQGVINPMVYNMAPAYDAATYDIVWISTSRIKGDVVDCPNGGYWQVNMGSAENVSANEHCQSTRDK